MPYLIVGIDDMDTEEGGCTTYVMYSYIKHLVHSGLEDYIVGLPRLTRLNPYVPFKTRGNASLSVVLRVDTEDEVEDYVELMQAMVDQMVKRVGKTSPGIAYVVLNDLSAMPSRLVWFYEKSVRDVVTMDLARRVAEKVNARLIGGRGVIGALASIGYLPRDATYEFIAYRGEGFERPAIEPQDVITWDSVTRPFTFLNVDGDRVLIEPHGPDPVLFGVRGDSPYHVIAMGNYLASKYGAIGWIVYLTNQGTDEHRTYMGKYVPYRNVNVVGMIINVRFDEHGHAYIELDNGMKAIAYRHLGISREIANCVGCLVNIWGGLKPNDEGVIYIEGIRVLHDREIEIKNPRCPRCGGPMESLGKSGILRCKRCGFKDKIPRVISARNRWLIIEPRRSEYRHLMKPVERIGLEGLTLYMPKPSLWIY